MTACVCALTHVGLNYGDAVWRRWQAPTEQDVNQVEGLRCQMPAQLQQHLVHLLWKRRVWKVEIIYNQQHIYIY